MLFYYRQADRARTKRCDLPADFDAPAPGDVVDVPNPPITIRMSIDLVKRTDHLAAAEHRIRASLVQHVLWEFVFAQEGIPAGPKAAKPARAAVPRKKSLPRKRVSAACVSGAQRAANTVRDEARVDTQGEPQAAFRKLSLVR